MRAAMLYSEPGLGGLVLGQPVLYLKSMRILMFQLSGCYYSRNSERKASLALCASLSPAIGALRVRG